MGRWRRLDVTARALPFGVLLLVASLLPELRGQGTEIGALPTRPADALAGVAAVLQSIPLAVRRRWTLVGVLALVLHRFSTGDSTSGPPLPRATDPMPVPTLATPPPQGRQGSTDHSSLPLYLVLALLAAVAVVLVVVAVVRRLRRFGLRVPQRPGLAGAAPGDDDARLLLSAVHSGRRALADTGEDARAAVIACYAAMEDALAASGVPRHASDSPADLLSRAVDAGFAPGGAAPRLTALFREARYSSHPMDASHRRAAADSLEEIAFLLGDRAGDRDGTPDVPGPEAGR
ncbi:DUF4129 domain-containing protein [Streptomyces sp. E5N298]|uniref:DUF4129 domain-containing protein n=1 Tax=Streptomyces sp. E5N298 TaxID=1851983 RepID=UPI001EE87A8C|nr:DUF4129 domain-containing protein [Streptomyces sp. E5N298]